MKRLICISILCFGLLTVGQSQNLVPNSSFEENKKIPNGQILNLGEYLYYWYNPTHGSPDYFHAASIGITSVPKQLFYSNTDTSYQSAHSGNAFVGFGVAGDSNKLGGTEYIQVQLKQPLLKSHVYEFVAYSNLLDVSMKKGFEIAFNVSSFKDTSAFDWWEASGVSPFKPPISTYIPLNGSDNINSTDWTRLCDTFVAKGGEQWLTIGTFDYGNIKIVANRTDVNYTQGVVSFAYYFIDDVSIIEIPSLIGPDTVCAGEVVELYSSFYGASCAWYGDADKAVLLSSDTFLSVEANISQWYYLETDIGSDSLFITVIPKPSLIAMPDTFYCSGEILSINVADRVTQSTSISWFDADSLFKKTFQLEGEYWFNVSNRFCSVLDTFRVVEKSNPETLASKEITICQMENHYDTIYLDSTLNYFWDDIGPQNFLRIFNENGIVKYQVTNKFGCYTEDSIRILDICMPVVYIPNAFVIGGYNNEFRPYLRYVLESELSIFNRWGEKIFTSADLNPQWDGTLNGEEQQEGVYLYLLTTKSSFGLKIYNGTFHLLKK